MPARPLTSTAARLGLLAVLAGVAAVGAPSRAQDTAIHAGGLVYRPAAIPADVRVIPNAGCSGARAETCGNALDDDCNGQIDEGCTVAHWEGAPVATLHGGVMQFTVAWSSDSDLNLEVTTPNNGTFDALEGREYYGGLYEAEVNSACTYAARPAEESIVYREAPMLGRYVVRVRDSYTCTATRTRATLSIAVGGRTVAAYELELDERYEERAFEFTLDDR